MNNEEQTVSIGDINKSDVDSIMFYKNAVENMDEFSLPTKTTPALNAIKNNQDSADISKLSLKELILSKSPSLSSKGYESLKDQISKTKLSFSDFKVYKDIIQNVPEIANPLLLKSAAECFKIYIENAPKNILAEIELNAIKKIINKQFSSPKYCETGIEMAIKLLICTENREILLKTIDSFGFCNKKPLIVNGCAVLFVKILKEFGLKLVLPAVFREKVSLCFESTNLTVRKTALNLACEMYRWGGKELLDVSLFKNLKKAQLETIQAELDKISPKSAKLSDNSTKNVKTKVLGNKLLTDPKNERVKDNERGFVKNGKNLPKTNRTDQKAKTKTGKMVETKLKSAKIEETNPNSTKIAINSVEPTSQPEPEASSSSDGNTDTIPSLSEKERKYEKDVLKQLKVDRKWLSDLENEDWKVKNALLISAIETAKTTPKIEPGEHTAEFFSLIARLTKDPNVNIVAKALAVIPPFSEGMKEKFEVWAKKLFPDIISRFKEKKGSVETACFSALNAIVDHSLQLDGLMEMIESALKHKTPKVRECTLIWLNGAVRKNGAIENPGSAEKLMKAAKRLFEDGAEGVRSNSYVLFAFLAQREKKAMGSVMRDLEKSNPRAFKAVSRLTESVRVCDSVKKAKVGGVTGLKEDNDKKVAVKRVKINAQRMDVKSGVKDGIRNPNLKTLRFPSKTTNKFLTFKEGDFQPISSSPETSPNLSKPEQNADLKKLSKLFNGNIISKLSKIEKKSLDVVDCKKTLQSLTAEITSLEEINDFCSPLIKVLSERIGWDTKDVGLAKTLFKTLQEILKRSTESLTEELLGLFLNGLINRIGEQKFNQLCTNCLNICSEIIGPEPVLHNALNLINGKHVSDSEIRKVHSALKWAETLFENFNISYFEDLTFVVHAIEDIYLNNHDTHPINQISKNIIEKALSHIEQPEELDFALESMRSTLKPRMLKKFLPNSLLVNEATLFDTDDLANLKTQKNWQKRHIALKHILSAIMSAAESEAVLGKKDLAQIEELLPLLAKSLEDRVILIVRHTLLAIRRVLPLVLGFEKEAVERFYFVVENGLFCCLCSNNKQVQVGAVEAIEKWGKYLKEDISKKKVIETLEKQNLLLSIDSKKSLLNSLNKILMNETSVTEKKKIYNAVSNNILNFSVEKDAEINTISKKILNDAIAFLGISKFENKNSPAIKSALRSLKNDPKCMFSAETNTKTLRVATPPAINKKIVSDQSAAISKFTTLRTPLSRRITANKTQQKISQIGKFSTIKKATEIRSNQTAKITSEIEEDDVRKGTKVEEAELFGGDCCYYCLGERSKGFSEKELNQIKNPLSKLLPPANYKLLFSNDQMKQSKGVIMLRTNVKSFDQSIDSILGHFFSLIIWILSVNQTARNLTTALLIDILTELEKKGRVLMIWEINRIVPFLIENGLESSENILSTISRMVGDKEKFFTLLSQKLTCFETHSLSSNNIEPVILTFSVLNRVTAEGINFAKEYIETKTAIIEKFLGDKNCKKLAKEVLRNFKKKLGMEAKEEEEIGPGGKKGSPIINRELGVESYDTVNVSQQDFKLPEIFKLKMEKLVLFMESENKENSDDGGDCGNDVSSLFLTKETEKSKTGFYFAERSYKNGFEPKEVVTTENGRKLAKKDTAVYNSDFRKLKERMRLLDIK